MTQWSGPFVGWRREREPMAASDVTLAHTLCCRPLLPLKAAIYSPLSPYILSLSPISILSSLSLSLSSFFSAELHHRHVICNILVWATQRCKALNLLQKDTKTKSLTIPKSVGSEAFFRQQEKTFFESIPELLRVPLELSFDIKVFIFGVYIYIILCTGQRL
jgi:hypothetical protein